MAQLPIAVPLQRRRKLVALLVLGVVLGAGLWGQRLWSRARRGPSPTVQSRVAAEPPIGAAPTFGEVPGGPPALATADPAAERRLWQERLRSAKERLMTYRSWARYPPDSRPAGEHLDRLQPTAPVTRALPMSHKGTPSQDVRLQLGQDRLMLVGSESARLSVRCEDSLGVSAAVHGDLGAGVPAGSGGGGQRQNDAQSHGGSLQR